MIFTNSLYTIIGFTFVQKSKLILIQKTQLNLSFESIVQFLHTITNFRTFSKSKTPNFCDLLLKMRFSIIVALLSLALVVNGARTGSGLSSKPVKVAVKSNWPETPFHLEIRFSNSNSNNVVLLFYLHSFYLSIIDFQFFFSPIIRDSFSNSVDQNNK